MNVALLLNMAMLTLGAMILLPWLLLTLDARWGFLLAPVALLSNGFWALHHEAIHGGFRADRRGNILAGRVMAILLGSSFAVLRFGHLMHHQYNRNPTDRPDVYDPARGSRLMARLGFLGNLLGGLYLVELLVPIACLLPRPLIRRIVDRVYSADDPDVRAIHQSATRLFLDPRRLAIIRTDALLAMALIGTSAYLFGPYWPMLAGFILARGLLISVVDNVYHFATPIDRPDYARNLWLPAPLRLLLLNMNLHRVHHARPALPWWELPGQLRASGDGFDAKLLDVAVAQFAGPVPLMDLPREIAPASRR
ncbi:MAG TPA: fatty acid desaturase [Dongiaceae bacterium]|nr:fatty acid desaturase [Dongiaceae bacterium]